jgi:ribA/ribD-fused uncharacterized protein
MDDTSRDILKTFYKGRSKTDSTFDYSAEGDLVEMDKKHVSVVRTLLTLNEYRPITIEEKNEMEEKRNEAIALATKNYDDAKKRLRQSVMKPDRSDSEYLSIMREVREADDQLFRTRFPMRYISKVEGVKWKHVLFDEMENDARTIPYPLRQLETSPFLITDMYVRIGKEAQKPLMTVKEIKKLQKAERDGKDSMEGRPILFFSSSDSDAHGFLSLDWRVDITLRGTTYHSARQALSVELAKLFNDQAHVGSFMETESPEGIRYALEDVPGGADANRIKWTTESIRLLYEIHTEKFTNYPALSAQLLETQNAVLASTEPNDSLLGIGLSEENPIAKNPKQWTGQNLLGRSLMDIRDLIQKQQEATTQKTRSMKRVKKPAVSAVQESSSTATAPMAATASASVIMEPTTMAATPAVSTQVPVMPVMNVASSSSSTSIAPPTVNVQPSFPRSMRRKPKTEPSASTTSITPQ